MPALREALQANMLNGPAVDHARSLAGLVRVVNDQIEPVRAAADYAAAGALRPAVLDELHWRAAQPSDKASSRLAAWQ
jgi:hypothetical protein